MAVFTDYSKAFDTIDFFTLIQKMHSLTFSTDFLYWVFNYLCLTTRVCLVYLVEGLVIVFLVLLKWEVAAILGNGCGVQGQNYVAWLQGSKMSVGGW